MATGMHRLLWAVQLHFLVIFETMRSLIYCKSLLVMAVDGMEHSTLLYQSLGWSVLEITSMTINH